MKLPNFSGKFACPTIFGIFLMFGLISFIPSNTYAQDLPDIDTSILDKTSEFMDKSLDVLEKTEDVLDRTEGIVEKTSDIADKAEQTSENLGGGCLIATATFGSELAPQVQSLRELRDNTLLATSSGASFMTGFNAIYYSFSPAIADLERENPLFKETVKIAITPLLSSLSLLSYADIDSESEMLGYGISIILLNIGMYFVAPVVLIHSLRRLLKQTGRLELK